MTRIYVGSNFVLREKLFVPLDLSGAIITYTVQGRAATTTRVRIFIEFKICGLENSSAILYPEQAEGNSEEEQRDKMK